MRKNLLLIICCLLICAGAYRWGGVKLENAKTSAMEQMYLEISKIFFPHIYLYESSGEAFVYRDMEKIIMPVVSSYRVSTGYTKMGQEEGEIENLQYSETETESEEACSDVVIDSGSLVEFQAGEETDTETIATATQKKVVINRTKLQEFDYLRQNFYQIDNTTTIDSKLLDVNKLLGKDMTLAENVEGPQILIYHTHSQEGYADSQEGDSATSVVALGDYLATLLSEQYGIQVLHHTGEYDVVDRDRAYSNVLPSLEQILKENPSIEVVIDIHRDGVPETTHLVTDINGKPTAQIMFFNGLSRTTAQGDLENLANPYIEENLAFSFQMQLAASEYYPGFSRRIYLKGYRYNMHLCPKSLLVEVGAQTNSFEEAKNAMEPLADILAKVLYNEVD